jgi:hypothetical protein
LDYSAPADCPDQSAFVERVRARTERRRNAELAGIVVRITPAANGFAGELELVDDAGASVSRRVQGEQCDAVVTSLALITALTLDTNAPAEAEITETAPPPPAPAAPPPAPVPVFPAAPAPSPVASPSVSRRIAGRLGAAAGYDAPLGAFSWGLSGQLDWRQKLAVRLTAHLGSTERTLDGRRAELRLIGVELSACPRWLLGSSVAIYPCGLFDLGSLSAKGVPGSELVSTDSAATLWAAVGPGLRLAWEPDVPFWAELHGRLLVPLVSHEFVFEDPPATVYEVAPNKVSAGAGVAAGVRF